MHNTKNFLQSLADPLSFSGKFCISGIFSHQFYVSNLCNNAQLRVNSTGEMPDGSCTTNI